MMSPPSTLMFVLLGAVLRSGAFNVLTDPVLAAIDPAIFAGLVAIGVLMGVQTHVGTSAAAPLMFGAALAPWGHAPTATVVETLVLFGVAVVFITTAAWLLVDDTANASEQHVFVLGTVLLLGGTAAYLSMSAVLAGFLAGAAWRFAGRDARDRIERDISYFQRPLMIVLLLVAGARFEPSLSSFELAVVCLMAGIALNVLLAHEADSWIAPGVIGIAAALDVEQAWRWNSEAAATVVATIVLVSLGWDVIAALGKSPEPAKA